MRSFRQKFLSVLAGAAILTGAAIGTASAHVVVKPAEAVTAGFITFTMGVPNEKDIANTSIKLDMPSGLKFVSPTQKPGWQVDVEKTGEGENASVKSITWSQGSVNPGFRDDFTFSAQVPEKATELQWKAYQTYEDGTVVSWDQAGDKEDEGGNSGPFSVTKVVSKTAADESLAASQKDASDAKSAANRALGIGIAGVVVALIALGLATRRP